MYVITGRCKRHRRYALIVTGVVAIALTFPLVASFLEIAREARIEAQLRKELITNTVTLKRTRLSVSSGGVLSAS